MERNPDTARAFALSIGIHLLIAAVILAGVWWSSPPQAVSVRGSPMEAVLMSAPANFKSAAQTAPAQKPPAAPPPQPKPEPRPQQAPTPPQPAPQAPPPVPDTRDTERAAQLALDQERERVEQAERERKRQEQVDLDAKRERDEAERRERLRQQQEDQQRELADIRAQREAAEKARRREEDKLKQLADQRNSVADAPVAREAPPADQLGNQGRDDSQLGRYSLAIQQSVTANWLRPDSARAGIRCALRIVQIPGGEVIQVSVSTPCNADALTRRSIEAAVLKAQPLPYRGFESVFQREIRFNFKYDGE